MMQRMYYISIILPKKPCVDLARPNTKMTENVEFGFSPMIY